MKRQIMVGGALALLTLISVPQAEAGDNRKRLGRISIVHRAGQVENQTFRADWKDASLSDLVEFDLRVGEEIIIEVLDPNPLFFDYTLGDITTQATTNSTEIAELATAVESLAKVLGAAADQAPSSMEGARLSAVVRNLQEFPSGRVMVDRATRNVLQGMALPGISEGLEDTIMAGEGDISLDPQKAAELKAIAERVAKEDEIAQKLDLAGINSEFFREFSDNLERLAGYGTSVPDLTARAAGTPADVEGVKEDTASWEIKKLTKAVNDHFKKMEDGEANLLLTLLKSEQPLRLRDVDSRLYALLMAQDRKADIKKTAEDLQAFRDTVTKIDVPIQLGRLTYLPDKISNALLEVKAKSKNIPAPAASRKTGKFNLAFSPRSPVDYSFGAAMVFSFVEKREFGTEPAEGGGFTIVRTDPGDDYFAQNVAAMLNITPRGWSNPIFGGQIDIGFTPKKDELAFYLGGSIRLFIDRVTLGGGVTYQEVQALDGQGEGDPIPTEDALKLDTEFKTGLYLSVGVKIN